MDEELLDIWKDGFERYLKTERNLKPRTYTDRRYRAMCFLKWCGKDFASISREDVLAYKEMLINKGLDNDTVNRHMLSCRYLFNYLEKELEPIRYLPVKKKVSQIPADSDIERLFRYCGNLTHFTILKVFVTTGIRSGELRYLSIGDVDFERRLLTIHYAKTQPDNVPISHETCKVLRDYLKARCQMKTLDGFQDILFPNQYGGRYTAEGLIKIFSRLGEKAGCKMRITPHKLRHYFATYCARRGTNAAVLQSLMRHSRIEMTARYIHLARHDVMDVYDKLFD